MSTETDPSRPTLPGSDLLHKLKVQLLVGLLTFESPSVTWVVGDTWLRYDEHRWWIGPDEPATEDEVRELLAAAGELPRRWEDNG